MIIAACIAIGVAIIIAGARALTGPTDADRVVASDLILFGLLGLVTLIGILMDNPYTFDIVLITALIGFLASVSLARALTRGKR